MQLNDQMKEVVDKAEIILRQRAKRSIFQLMAESLGSLEITLLQSLGIDAEAKLLQIFVEESQILLDEHREDVDAGTGSS